MQSFETTSFYYYKNGMLHVSYRLLKRRIMKSFFWCYVSKRNLVYVIFAILSFIVIHSYYSNNHRKYVRTTREGPFRGYKDCNPELDIVFHKTHKCSSSTIQNILLRYSLKHDLNVVMPKSGNYLGKSHFNADLLKGTPWEIAGMHYNIFCLHNKWNGPEVERLMGRMKNQRPIYFTILRDPVNLFVSLWDYLQLSQKYGGISLEEYALSDKVGKYADRIQNGHFGRNQMLWDFGLNQNDFDNLTKVQSKIEEIEATFDLVLITEKFSESIVLLKELLCWDFHDMTSLKLNAQKSSTKSKLSYKARQKLEEWMHADYLLYNHFLAKFELELDNFGSDRLNHELEILNHANTEIEKRCVVAQVDNKDLSPEDRLHGHGVLGYKMDTNQRECSFLGMKEIKFLDILRKLQTQRAEEISGLKFTDESIKFKTLGEHVSLDELKSLYKYKGP